MWLPGALLLLSLAGECSWGLGLGAAEQSRGRRHWRAVQFRREKFVNSPSSRAVSPTQRQASALSSGGKREMGWP